MESDNFQIGKQIGNYKLTELLGTGTFGTVYLARHLYLERKVAIKILKEQYLLTTSEQDDFFNEAKILDVLKHRYVLPIIDVGRQEDSPYMMVEYAPQGSLQSRIANKRPPMWESLMILGQIGQALHYAHQNNVVHRDLKPANVLFSEKGEAVLADFGIAVLLEETGRTQSTNIVGTFPYMAPEQFAGLTSVKSDQYALGCIAYELLTGYPPITAPRGADFLYWADKVTRELPRAPGLINPDIPEHIDKAILTALEKDRSKRHADVSVFIASMVSQAAHFVDLTQYPTSLSAKESQLIENLPKKTSEQWLAEGNEHMEKENLEAALVAYEQAIQLTPDRDILYNVKGKVLHALKLYEDALKAYNEAIRLSPNKAIFYINKGNVQRDLGAYQEALDTYELSLLLAPNSVIAANIYTGKADALLKLERIEEALEAYKRATELEPGNFLLHRTKGDMFRRLGLYDEALQAYDQALVLSPNNPPLLNRKSIILRLQRKPENPAG